MRKLTSQGEQVVADLSARYGVSADAVRAMLEAVRLGNGTMAQFSHPEFGGRGQWMAGGMTMVADMFNQRLQATVSGLASELASQLAAAPLYAPAPDADPGPVHQANLESWWPGELGRPGSSGGQNDSRYAVFPQVRRLAVQSGGGPVRVHDTLDHVIGGVQQQQGAVPGALSFTSQHGTFTVESLPLAAPAAAPPVAGTAARQPPAPAATVKAPEAAVPPAQAASVPASDADAVLATLDRLGDLHQRGVLTDEEFAAKKAELLARL
ncbi:SHOCT domain-containing protein [Frankia sp. AgB1.9]|uniref:SHOCT domain-containing protein n=1 Tax=unclassified Frankia TaxID=2632575 RepID=UPI001932A6C0|nr:MULTISPECIES: SHOCT domain-containing protein [unclassified Frankia]MBL7492925.1 SHOCT domain-containing protein [Frankia sp. AgW1.1]MBL7550547.1 SHOCT domain-containing protein [Frankia sp. AgB1.9]MBL7624937.1 SHOCT domain-containing protein [Frankia sp. AgB1.8]